MTRLRVGIIGAGTNARALHLPDLTTIDDVELVAVANRSERSAQRVARDFGIPRVFDDWRALLAAGLTDAIVVGTRPDLHAEITMAALEAGNHVLTEARVTATAAQARAVLAASRARPDLVVQVVPVGFSLEQDVTIRRLVDTELGDLVAVEATFHERSFVDTDAPLHWRDDPAAVGINVMTVGRRYETLLRWLPPVTEVFAAGRTLVRERFDVRTERRVPLPLPDLLTVVGRYPDDALLTATFSTVVGHGPAPTVRLYGTDATLVFEGESKRILLGRRGGGGLEPTPVPAHERFPRRVAGEFVDAIRGTGEVWRTRLEDAVRYMEFTDAVQRSVTSGRWEPVHEPDRARSRRQRRRGGLSRGAHPA